MAIKHWENQCGLEVWEYHKVSMAAVRVRQHVNPLAIKYQRSIDLPDWKEVYGDLSWPLHLDIGCGRGRFLLEMAQLHPHRNFLGLEIRESLVEKANQQSQALKLSNLHFLFCNANISLGAILSTWEKEVLQWVTIQFPDPWFKKRHQKRRVVQPQLLDEIAAHLMPKGLVLVQSDVQSVALEMVRCLDHHPAFTRQTEGWLAANPLPVPTEREKVVVAQGKPVYRALFVRWADI